MYYNPPYSTSTNYVTLLQHINTATQLNGLYLFEIPNECVELLQSRLPLLSNLQEIVLDEDVGVPCASLLPQISKLSNIKYFGLRCYTRTRYEKYFLQIMNSNTDSLKGLELSYIEYIGLNSWSELLLPLKSCTNLVQIQLLSTTLRED